MPWIAKYNGEKKPPRQVPKDADAECVSCGGRVRVRGPFKDGRPRHFWHIDNVGSAESAAGGGGSCDAVAESDQHMMWKSIAADELEHIFADNIWKCEMEYELQAPISEKDHRKADALCLFDELDDQLGQGIAIEVQYKNDSKDLQAVEADYLEQKIAVVWVTEDDFVDRRFALTEADLRYRAAQTVWPDHAPPITDWKDRTTTETSRFGGETSCPAKLPSEYFDDVSQSIWQNTEWESIFSRSEDPFELDFWDFSEVPATIPFEWTATSTKEYWRSRPWKARFRGDHRDYIDTASNPSRPGNIPFLDWIRSDESGYYYTIIRQYFDSVQEENRDYIISKCPDCLHKNHSKYYGESQLSTTCEKCGSAYLAYKRGQADNCLTDPNHLESVW